MINFITLITSLRQKNLDRRINELEITLHCLRDSRRSASRHRSVFFENKKIEDIICEIDKRIPATRAKLERLYNKRKRLQHD